MINPQWFELPISRINSHGPKMFELLRFYCAKKCIGMSFLAVGAEVIDSFFHKLKQRTLRLVFG